MQRIATAAEFMTRRVLTVFPDMDIGDAVSFLLAHKIAGAPVVGHDGSDRLVGILSEGDCLKIVSNGAFYGTPKGSVADFMATNVRTISPTDDVFSIATIFVDKRYRRLPVVEGDKLVGIVSRSDVLRLQKRIWDNRCSFGPPDNGYLTPEIKARLGMTG
jgi:CBS domain-containing protein